MMPRKRLSTVLAVALAALLVAGTVVVVRQAFFGPRTITAYFTSATGIYPGDEVRVAGVRVGTIESIEPDGAQARMRLAVDRDVPIPADVKAVIVAQNLVSSRYVALAPAYEESGPTLPDDAVLGVDRTAVPVEWDEVKEQLTRLATDLGPNGEISQTSVSRFIDSAANAMDGNGEKLRETITQLSAVGRILADGSGNIVDIISNLQTFVTALRDSNTQIVQFQDRLATVSSVIDSSRSDLDAALTHLSEAVGEVQRFVAGSRNQTAEQIQRLAEVTKNLADNRLVLENVLHAAPNALANGYNIYNPDTGTMIGSFAMANFANPVQLICSGIGALKNVTADDAAKACAEYLGPALRLMNFNNIPMPLNVYLQKSPSPWNLIYSDPAIAPGGAGGAPQPPEQAPAVSAYTGAGDIPPPPGWDNPPAPPGAYTPHGLPAVPQPALFPGAPIPPGPAPAPAPQPTSLQDMLLPAEAPTEGQAPS